MPPIRSAELALVPAECAPASGRDDDHDDDHDRARRVARGPGWFDSSWDLQRGLEVREGWSAEDGLHGWIESFLTAQRSCARTASPSASTAIA